MKWLVLFGMLLGAYTYVLLHTTNIVLTQTQQLNASYQNVARKAESMAADQ